jgi:hypothetical protein
METGRCKRCPNVVYPDCQKGFCHQCARELKEMCMGCWVDNKFPCECRPNIDTRCQYCGKVVGSQRLQHYRDDIVKGGEFISAGTSPRFRNLNIRKHIIGLAEHELFNVIKNVYPQMYYENLSNLKLAAEMNNEQMVQQFNIPLRFFSRRNPYDSL